MGRDKRGVTVAIGSDHAGYHLKERLKGELAGRGFRVLDFGAGSEESSDYPDFGLKVALAVSRGEADLGVLTCGSGVGMGIVANKVPGVRAAVCNEAYCARLSRAHNDANVLTIGARVVSEEDALVILDEFLKTPFEGDTEAGARHARRLEKIRKIECGYAGDPESR